MTMTQHNWIRYWVPAEKGYSVDGLGFPVNPAADHAYFYQTEALRFEELTAKCCLILLGDPGLGKTNAMREAHKAAETALAGTPDMALRMNLGEYEDQGLLVTEVFKSQEMQRWVDGDGTLHLFLDSLDEGLLHVKTIARTLDSQLRRLPVERLKLRIACRSAEWPESLTKALREIFHAEGDTEKDLGEYHLMPLPADDVRLAARNSDIDPNTFLEAVLARDIASMAMRPVTLMMLLGIFKNDGGLPASKWDVYEKGCLRLCEDSEDRKGGGCASALPAQQKLTLAGHAFCHMLLTNKAFIWRGSDSDPEAAQGLPEYLLQGAAPIPGTKGQNVTRAELREAFNVGLFARKGENRIAAAHQTYAEFLACRHLLGFDLTLEQLMGLLFGEDGHPVPQLEELAGWLAGRRADLRNEIIRRDPMALLRGDVAALSDEDRARIVDGILGEVQRAKIEGHWEWRDLAKLHHPDIAEQLRGWLAPESGVFARKLAVLIAMRCEVKDLSQKLASISLDSGEDHPLRARAAMAISEIGTPEARRTLAPLIYEAGSSESVGELRGYTLRAAWPDHVNIEEFFRRTHPRLDDHHYGLFDTELRRVTQSLTREQFPAALLWIARNLTKPSIHYEEVVKDVLCGACKHLDNQLVADALLTCVTRLQADYHSEIEPGKTADTIREALAAAGLADEYVLWQCAQCVEQPDRMRGDPLLTLWSPESPFLRTVELYDAEPDLPLKIVLGHLARNLYDNRDSGHTEVLLTLMDTVELFRETFGCYRTGSILESPEAQKIKAEHYRHEALRQKWANRQKPPIITARDVETTLKADFAPEEAWPRLHDLLHSVPGKPEQASRFELPLPENPMWEVLSPTLHESILRIAADYLQNVDPTDSAKREPNRIFVSDLLGLDALHLLAAQATSLEDVVPTETITKWLPDIVGMPVLGTGNATEMRTRLIQKVMAYLPELTMELIARDLSLNAPNPEGHLPDIMRCLNAPWSKELATVVAQQVESPDSSSEFAIKLLERLAEAAPAKGAVLADRFFQKALKQGTTEVAAKAASILMRFAPHPNWEPIWQAITADADFSHAFICDLAHFRRFDLRRMDNLYEDELAAYYLHLFTVYPNKEDGELSGFVSSRDGIRDFKRYILEHLSRRGTRNAVTALEQIQKHDPELDWVRYHVAQATDALRRNSWIPPTSEQFNALLRETGQVFVQNGQQLMEVVLRQLRVIEERLHGHTPRSPALWNEGSKCKPKPENDFSDYLKGELEDALRGHCLILNREVEIRSPAIGLGERVDLHVDAFVPGPAGEKIDRIKLIIEVKGCWNPELKTAMETQLVNRYMRDSDCKFGIYLVGWFNCERWSDEDPRRSMTPPISIDEARDILNRQAQSLCEDDLNVASYVMNTGLRIKTKMSKREEGAKTKAAAKPRAAERMGKRAKE